MAYVEDAQEEMTWNHFGFYRGQEKLSGLIEEIFIDMNVLEEKKEIYIKEAEQASLRGSFILWHLDFHFQENPLFVEDPALFFSSGLSIEEFVEKIYGSFRKNTLGFSLFRGDADFTKYLVWSHQQEVYYQEKVEEWGDIQEFEKKRMFAADVLSQYLQRLSSFLPDSLPVFCFIDALQISSKAFAAFLFTRERFGHLLLSFFMDTSGCLVWNREGFFFKEDLEISLGVCLPCHEKISQAMFKALDDLLLRFYEKGVLIRLLEEDFLNESWDGINDLVILSQYVSDRGVRKIRGFAAAGGRIILQGASLGFEEEVNLSEYLK